MWIGYCLKGCVVQYINIDEVKRMYALPEDSGGSIHFCTFIDELILYYDSGVETQRIMGLLLDAIGRGEHYFEFPNEHLTKTTQLNNLKIDGAGNLGVSLNSRLV